MVTLALRPAPKGLAWQCTHERGDAAARLHSDMRRQPSTRTHRAVGSDNNRPTLELAIAREFVSAKEDAGAHARPIFQKDEVFIWTVRKSAGQQERV